MNEQILKRLQDALKTYLLVLEQMEQVQWLIKDIIEDLELELHTRPGDPEPERASQEIPKV